LDRRKLNEGSKKRKEYAKKKLRQNPGPEERENTKKKVMRYRKTRPNRNPR